MNPRPIKHYAGVAALLLLLLMLTIGLSYLNLGSWNTPIAMFISVAKALLILLFFMQACKVNAPTFLFVIAGFIWLSIMFALAMSDFLTR